MSQIPERCAAIVLAAGTSTRFGPDNKILAPLRGKPVIAHTLKRLIEAGVSNITVVTGHQSGKVKGALTGFDLKFQQNPGYQSGLGSSISAGVSSLTKEVEAALIVLGDMPLVRADTIQALFKGLEQNQGKFVAVPTCQGRRGNPVLWRRAFFAKLKALDADQGAKSIMARTPEAVVEIPVDDSGIHFDIDSLEDIDAFGKEA